jgi:hypothetical protein
MKQIHFFALKEDILLVLGAIERDAKLQYTRMGLFSAPAKDSFEEGGGIPSLGEATTDSASSGQSFLVAKSSYQIGIRPIKVGIENRYAIDQLMNQDTVVFSHGGLWSKDFVISGRVSTVSDSIEAQWLMKRFGSAFKRNFSKVKAFYVGPQALSLLNAGKRLTASIHSPEEYDLTL